MINHRVSTTLTLDTNEFLVNSMTINYSFNSAFPTTTLVVGNADHVFIAGEIADYDHLPVVTIVVLIEALDEGGGIAETLSYNYQGVLTGVNGGETQTELNNTLTVMPAAYYATLKTSSFDGTSNQDYLLNAQQLANDIIVHFNNNVFTSIPGIGTPVVLSPVEVPSAYNRLLIAPRFLGMTLHEMLEQIFGVYGYSVLFTWDNRVIVGSLNNPIVSEMLITKDMIGDNSFRDEVSLNIMNTQLGW